MTTTIFLYGALGRRFGRCWKLSISTIAEAVRAIDSQAAGFARAILELDCSFLVRRDGEAVCEEMLPLPAGRTIAIVPCPSGAGGNGILSVILGVALVGAAFLVPGLAGAAAGTFLAGVKSAFIAIGFGMTLTGVSSLLSRSPRQEDTSSDQRKPSYLFSGNLGVTQQGDPVPVLYGRAIIYPRPISAGISARDYTAGSTSNTGGSSVVADPAAPAEPIYNEP